ncbi:hypothetical protein Q7P37_007868 [Cladosporium fusiforme]
MDSRDQSQRIVIVGGGAFGLSTALELTNRGFNNIVILDRHLPPVPDGSSVDISRIIRFDYGDAIYARLAKEAYDLWTSSPLYQHAFYPTPFTLVANNSSGRSYIDKCTQSLDQLSLPWQKLESAADTRSKFPALSGQLAHPDFQGYINRQAGWADAQKAIAGLRDQCIAAGVSFICGARGTVMELIMKPGSKKITGVKTLANDTINGDFFVLAAGAWSSSLVPMRNTTLSTAQIIAFMKLTDAEMKKYEQLPIYMNFSSGWFCFPPHQDTRYLKFVIHGMGYTRTEEQGGSGTHAQTTSPKDTKSQSLSTPPRQARNKRANFAPADGIKRLRAGLQEALPELASRELDMTTTCWYTDTPTGDFILDYHHDYSNLFLATGGSGHAFKFLPVLGKYITDGIEQRLSRGLKEKWRFGRKGAPGEDPFRGDGSRGGPVRREFTTEEKAKLRTRSCQEGLFWLHEKCEQTSKITTQKKIQQDPTTMARLSLLLTALIAASGATASLVAQARRALFERQSSSPQVNAIQRWGNDFADFNFKTGSNGMFSVDWNNRPGGNFVVGRGYQPAREMLVNYTGTFRTSGAAYLALYGWTDNPLVEYYVIEAMGNHNPSDNISSTQYGCLQSDGGTYEIWQKKRTNAPSIKGDHTDFEQFWSVRTSMHVGGTINTGNHFRAWEAAGLKLGTQLYMDIVIEGQRGAGNATLTVGTAPKTSVPNTPTPTRRTERAPGTCPRSGTTKTSRSSSTTHRSSTAPPATTASTTRAGTATTPTARTSTATNTTAAAAASSSG